MALVSRAGWRAQRERLTVLAACGALLVGAAACSDDSGAGEERGDGAPGSEAAEGSGDDTTSTTLDAGDLEISAPNGWREVPLPALGFGLAIPEQWEAVVLSEEGLDALRQADPAVPGFADAAHATAEAGGIFYAAGVEADDRVTDLKVRAAPGTGITTAAALYEYARQLATEAGLVEPTIRTVTDADRPTVVIRYSTEVEPSDPDDPDAEPQTVQIEGSELLVVSPAGVVYSLIVTSEHADGHDAFAERLFETLTFTSPDAAGSPDAAAAAAPDEGE
ncbi:MAG TPA: hypothetical protein VIL36_00815 [Acidimicrobiales bacterium]